MLMGVDIEGISIIIFVRPMNMLHYVVQGRSSTWEIYSMKGIKNTILGKKHTISLDIKIILRGKNQNKVDIRR